jgi:glycosyltransferase involved in cell wall biosynthesis
VNKIVIIYNKLKDPGGAERLALNFLNYLESNNHKAELWTTQINEDSLFSLNLKNLKNLKNWLNIYIRIFRETENIYIIDSGFLQFYIVTFFFKIKYFIHLHHPLFMSYNDNDKYAYIHRKWLDQYLKSNIGAQNLIKPKFNILQILKLNIRAYFFYKFIRKAKDTFVLSEYSKQEKMDLFGVKAKVLQGALTQIFPYDSSKYKNIQTLNFLMVGRLDKNKRIDNLIKSFLCLVNYYRNKIVLKLDIVGSGSELSNLKGLTNQLNLEEKVCFHGYINESNLKKFYQNSHIFISLDWADYKITMFEALNYSNFVIVTNETEISCEIQNSNRVYKSDLEFNTIVENTNSILQILDSDDFTNDILKPYLWSNYFSQTVEIIKEK